MTTLISNTAFGKYLDTQEISLSCYKMLRQNFDKFLSQSLELWMFVPCDEDGEPFEEPKNWKDYLEFPESFDGNKEWYEFYTYEQAKERCLFDVKCIDISNGVFKGLQFKSDSFKMVEYNIITKKFFYGCSVVEDLIDYNIQLTQTAIKQIGL